MTEPTTVPDDYKWPNPDDYDDYDYGNSYNCMRCNGEGLIVVCMDDLCRGSDDCFHGDGYGSCPDCNGSGEVSND